MKLDEDRVPVDLDEAVKMIVEALQPDEVKNIQEAHEDRIRARTHHSIGQYIRNGWSLWQRDTPLSLWFAKHGITHGDDKWGIIITSVIRQIRGVPRDLSGQIACYHEHWQREIGRPIP
jgi:hypothetical protein